MESVSETGYGKIGESAKKSHTNDSGLQRFELRGKVDKVWANNDGEKEEQKQWRTHTRCVRCVRTPCENVNFVVYKILKFAFEDLCSHHPEISEVFKTHTA